MAADLTSAETLRDAADWLMSRRAPEGLAPGITWAAIALDARAGTATPDVTLRDLIRAAHVSGAPLRRRFDDIIHRPYWECWGKGIDRRRALVRYWPDGLWRVELYSHYVATHDDIDHAVRVVLIDPTLTQIVEAARLCGWEVPRRVVATAEQLDPPRPSLMQVVERARLATVDRGEAS